MADTFSITANPRRLLRLAALHGADAVIRAADGDEAMREALDALDHDDSEWAEARRGSDVSNAPRRNDAGEWVGLM
jgi:hypothetical protein